jgi:small subunit ribosomal protein S16
MSVKIRLTRMGKKKQPTYRVVVMDSRKPRDGAYLEQIGRYDPRQDPSIVEIDNDRALDWLQKGAQPTERARKLLEISGAWMRFRVSKGDIYTVGETEAAAVEEPTPPPVTATHEPEVHVVGDPIDEDEPSEDSAAPVAGAAEPEHVAEVHAVGDPIGADGSSQDSAVPSADAAGEAAEDAATSEAPEAGGDDTGDATGVEASSDDKEES